MCSSGEGCTRNICFFAHNEQELRKTPEVSEQWPAASSGQLLGSGGTMVSPCAAGSSGSFTAAPGAMGEQMAGGMCALSPANSHSSPLPSAALPGNAWCAVPACSTPASAGSPQAQQLQFQALLQQQQQGPQHRFVVPASAAGPTVYGPTAALLVPGMLGTGVSQAPVVMTSNGSSGLLCAVSQPQEIMMAGQHEQYSSGAGCYNIAAAAGMFTSAGSSTSSGFSQTGTNLVALGSTAAATTDARDELAMSTLKWQQHQQQQQAAAQHTAMLLQQLQLSHSTQLSTESLPSSMLVGSSNSTIAAMSQLTLCDLSTDSLAALMPHGYALPQDMPSNHSLALSGAAATTQELQLLPLESSGLIQLSALDEPAGVTNQQKQLMNMTMQQAGRYW